ncbi:MAG: hypothetical protein ACOZIN_09705 [Myxococcota bacterium]
MQNGPLPRRVCAAPLALALAFGAGCYREITSEERLDLATQDIAVKDVPGAEELAKIDCGDTQAELVSARNVNKPEADRVLAYVELYQSLQKRSTTFEEAMARNPDLAYQEGSQKLVEAKELCVQQTADVRVEFERYVRELVDVPTVKEVKGGSTITVARLDFDTLRTAIEALDPDDKDQLLSRVESAEKRVDAAPEKGRKRGK